MASSGKCNHKPSRCMSQASGNSTEHGAMPMFFFKLPKTNEAAIASRQCNQTRSDQYKAEFRHRHSVTRGQRTRSVEFSSTSN